MNENINYIGILISGKRYGALYDTCATTAMMGKAMAKQLEDRLTPSTSSIKEVRDYFLKVPGNL